MRGLDLKQFLSLVMFSLLALVYVYLLMNGWWKSSASLGLCFLALMVDYLGISLDIGMVFYYYAIIFFNSSIVMLGARWKV